MNLKKVYSLSLVFIKGVLRGSYKKKTAHPAIFFLINSIIFTFVFLITYYSLQVIDKQTFKLKIVPLMNEILIISPLLFFFMFILIGIFLEIEISHTTFNIEIINWSPIKPTEYIFSLILSTIYIYSFPLSIFSAIIIPYLIKIASYSLIFIFILMCFLSSFFALLIIELIKITIENSFKKFRIKKGRIAIFIRMIIIILLISSLMVFMNPRLIQTVIFGVKEIYEILFYYPFSWPSNSLNLIIQGKYFLSFINAASFILLTFLTFIFISSLREKYWSVYYPSIIIETKKTKQSFFIKKLGMNLQILALIIKDIRSLIRRVEMIKIYAPIVGILTLAFFLKTSSIFLISMIPSFLIILITSTLIGQEGKSIKLIFQFPVFYKTLLKSKLFLALIISIIFSIISTLFIIIIIGIFDLVKIFIIFNSYILFSLICSIIGLIIAFKYPKFEETKMGRMLTTKGMYVSIIIGGIFLSFTSNLIQMIIEYSLEKTLLSISFVYVLILLIGLISYNILNSLAKKFMEEIPLV